MDFRYDGQIGQHVHLIDPIHCIQNTQDDLPFLPTELPHLDATVKIYCML